MEKREPDKIPNGQEDKKKADRRKKEKTNLRYGESFSFLQTLGFCCASASPG